MRRELDLPSVSRRGVLWGAVAAVLLTAVFVEVIARYFVRWADYFDPIMVNGLLLLLSSMIRAGAGIVAGRAHRQQFRDLIDSPRDYLPTALTAGALGWLLWTLLLGALGDWSLVTTLRGWVELPRWMIELALGSLLVSTQEPEDLTRRFRTRSYS